VAMHIVTAVVQANTS